MRASRFIASILVLSAIGMAMIAVGPIGQPPAYHHFADQRTLAGIPHAWDVLSNLVFLASGLYGLSAWESARRVRELRAARPSYGLFFIALIATCVGSMWYHLAPSDARLLWDRLPIAVGCAALLGIVCRETLKAPGCITGVLLGFALVSIAWWGLFDDLRPYLLLQAGTLVAVPLLQYLGGAPRGQRRAFAAAVLCYVLAKVCELQDQALYDLLGIGGHTLKHLLAGAGTFAIARYFVGRCALRKARISAFI